MQCKYASSRADHLTTNEKTQRRKIELVCNYFSSQVCSLRTHLKIHIGKKSNNCNQCDYSSFLEEDLRKHLKTFRGEMLKNAPTLTIYPLGQEICGCIWKHTVEKSKTSAINVTMHLFVTCFPVWHIYFDCAMFWRNIWKYTVEKSQTNATNVIMHLQV